MTGECYHDICDCLLDEIMGLDYIYIHNYTYIYIYVCVCDI